MHTHNFKFTLKIYVPDWKEKNFNAPLMWKYLYWDVNAREHYRVIFKNYLPIIGA